MPERRQPLKDKENSIQLLSEEFKKKSKDEKFSGFTVRVKVDEESSNVLRAFGALSSSERSIVMSQIFEKIGKEISDIMAIRCYIKTKAIDRENTNKKVRSFRKIAKKYKKKLTRDQRNRKLAKKQDPQLTADASAG